MRWEMQRCAVRSRGVFGFGCESKYAGAATMAARCSPVTLDGDHVALHELAEVNAGIEAPGDQIGAAVPFGRDVEHHLGVVADELRELRPHDHRDRHG